jgi:hypothetical protein
VTDSPPQQWKMPRCPPAAIRAIRSAASEASVGVATLLMSGPSQTVKRSPARSARTIEATK